MLKIKLYIGEHHDLSKIRNIIPRASLVKEEYNVTSKLFKKNIMPQQVV